MNLRNILIGVCSLLFIMIGADKFLAYLEPPCSMMNHIPTAVWSLIGVLQIAGGILIWLPKFRKYVVGFFFVFMLAFTVIHLVSNTYDVGGSVFMAVLLGILAWNPAVLGGKEK